MKRLFIISLLLFFTIYSFAQVKPVDSVLSKEGSTRVQAVYYSKLGPQSELNNGTRFVNDDASIQGHAYYDIAELRSGSLRYDGLEVQEVKLMYDLVRDQLVAEHYSKQFYINLVGDLVDSFSIGPNRFIHLKPDSVSKSSPKAGFYQVLATGKATLLVKRKKVINKYTTSTVERVFEQSNEYYIKLGDQYHLVSSRNDALSVFKEASTALRQLLNQQHLNFRKSPEEVLIKMTNYYNASAQ
jgi:hypothetical protein